MLMILKFISEILDQSYADNHFTVDGCMSYAPSNECIQGVQIWHNSYYK